MQILIADSFGAEHVQRLRDAGHAVSHEPDLDDTTLVEAVAGADVLVVRSTKVTAAAIDAADQLTLIVRAGAGVNTIDVAAAARAGVLVANTPGQNSIAVAELTIGLITALDRRIPDAVADLRAGTWRKKFYSKAQGLAGRTLGIIGLGSIGMEVASRAVAMRMRVVSVTSPRRSGAVARQAKQLGIELYDSVADMLGECDIVSLHVPANPETKNLVDASFLGAMRDGSWIINTSRGDVIDEGALLDALENRNFRAGLDVFADEPASGEAVFTNPLARHPSVYATHHIGASTEQAQEAIADAVTELVLGFGRGVVPDGLNSASQQMSTATLLVRHRNIVGALVSILGKLRTGGLNVEKMTNQIFDGGEAAIAVINVSGAVSDELCADVRALPLVLGLSVSTR